MNTKKRLQYILIFGGIIGLFFSFIITIEKINLIQNPNYIPPCNFNPLISCGSVMKTPQASLFGFPNPLLGIAGFAIMITVGMAMAAGATFKRWFWIFTQAGMKAAVIFVYWLAFQSIYRIGALCFYCIIVWIVTIPMFWYVTLYNLDEKNIKTPQKLESALVFVRKHHLLILSLVYLIIIFPILTHFWSYWKTVL
jgi:uncharacterized membrane protein